MTIDVFRVAAKQEKYLTTRHLEGVAGELDFLERVLAHPVYGIGGARRLPIKKTEGRFNFVDYQLGDRVFIELKTRKPPESGVIDPEYFPHGDPFIPIAKVQTFREQVPYGTLYAVWQIEGHLWWTPGVHLLSLDTTVNLPDGRGGPHKKEPLYMIPADEARGGPGAFGQLLEDLWLECQITGVLPD